MSDEVREVPRAAGGALTRSLPAQCNVQHKCNKVQHKCNKAQLECNKVQVNFNYTKIQQCTHTLPSATNTVHTPITRSVLQAALINALVLGIWCESNGMQHD